MNRVGPIRLYPSIPPDRPPRMNSHPPSSENHYEPPDDYDEIRTILLEKPTEDIERELPGLIDTLSTHSIDSDETIRFVVGVSFTTHGTCFDYWVDRVIRREGNGHIVSQPVKQPINENHSYVKFCYPPDQYFDAATLKGALLATVETHLDSREFDAHNPAPRSLRGRLRDWLRGLVQ